MAVKICNSLPQDIIIEILSWLPAKSLITISKLVCKAWYTSIHDHVFVKMHLNRGAINGGGGGTSVSSYRSNNNNSLICKSGNELFQLHPPFNFEGILPPAIAAAAATTTKIDFDSSLLLGSRLVGSCNGLLCLSRSIKHNESIIILLNPSTRRFKVSPKQPIECPPDFYKYDTHTYGFGCCYNSIDNIDEYKVIRIVCFYRVDNHIFSFRYQYDIYYMSLDSWRRETKLIRDYPYVIFEQQSGVFLNGGLHWMAYGTTPKLDNETWDTIVSFDIKDEEFRQVPIPLSFEPTTDDPYFHMEAIILMNMRGCLAMIRFSDGNNNMDVDLEIWVMKEYGIKESWTEEFVIRSADLDPPSALSGFEISLRSNAFVLKGDQILIEGRKDTDPGSQSPPDGYRENRVLYDINKRKIHEDFLKMVGVPDEPNVDQVDYIETLVSLKSINASFEQQANNRKRKNCS